MKLIKQLETYRNHLVAKTTTYKNVTFPNSFASFLEALQLEHLIPTDAKRTVDGGKWRWADGVGDGMLLVETTKHPLLSRTHNAGDVTVVGNKDMLERFEALLRLHEAKYEGATKPKDTDFKHQYHDTLNPILWDDKQLKPEIKDKLLKAADAFVASLKVEDLDVEDIILTGSNANYNWTQASDVDLHVVVDYDKLEDRHGDLVEEYFNAKKGVFNILHDIKIGGHEVEFYVQDSKEPHVASGVYSLADDKWNKEPEHKQPSVDDAAVRAKTADMMSAIDTVTDTCDQAVVVEELMEKIKKMRQAGLEQAGEFSVENLVFKQLRHNGYLEKLSTCKTRAFDRDLSIEDEEWSHLC